MDKLYIRGLEIFAYHGVNPEEKQDGQHFFMDVTLWADLSRPRQTDRLEDTVNYAAVRKTIHRAFTPYVKLYLRSTQRSRRSAWCSRSRRPR